MTKTEEYYRKIVLSCYYDEKIIDENTETVMHQYDLFKAKTKVMNLPEIEAKYLQKKGYGVDLTFVMYLIHKSPYYAKPLLIMYEEEEEDNKKIQRLALLYQNSEGYFVCDPGKEIREFTHGERMQKAENIKYDKIPLKAFIRDHAEAKIYPDLYSSEIKNAEFFSNEAFFEHVLVDFRNSTFTEGMAFIRKERERVEKDLGIKTIEKFANS